MTLALGCAPLGGLFSAVSDEDALATVDAAWEAGIRCFDVAPLYGLGRAEERLGRALRNRPRAEFTISTKVGRLLVEPGRGDGSPGAEGFVDLPAVEARFDFSHDAVLRSLSESLERLGLERVDVVLVHDPDDHLDQALASALPALCELRAQGVIGEVGAGMNFAAPLKRIVREADVDRILVAGRYTLLDHASAEGLLELCVSREVSVMAGGVFNSGVLAGGDTFDYAPATPETLARARSIAAVCERHGVPVTAAAMQFPLRHAAVDTVLVGARSAREVRENAAAFGVFVPPELWVELSVAGE